MCAKSVRSVRTANDRIFPRIALLVAAIGGAALLGCSRTTPEDAALRLQTIGVRINEQEEGHYWIDARNLPDFTDREIRLIAQLPNVTSVTMQNVSITDNGLSALEPLTEMSRLILNDTDVTAEGLARLPRKRAITNLGMSGTSLTDEDMAVFRQFPNLSRLDVSETEVGDAGLKHLERLNLRMLNVTGTNVTDEGAAAFEETVPGVNLVR